MLEIFFLRWFAGSLADTAEGKGRSRAWGAFGVISWLFAEVMGFVVALGAGQSEAGAYGLAIAAAVVSALVSWGLVSALPAVEPEGAPIQF